MYSEVTKQLARGFIDWSPKLGPVKWHKLCSRYHRARAGCGLVEVTRIAKSGNEVKRWAHPTPKKSKSKTKARKT